MSKKKPIVYGDAAYFWKALGLRVTQVTRKAKTSKWFREKAPANWEITGKDVWRADDVYFATLVAEVDEDHPHGALVQELAKYLADKHLDLVECISIPTGVSGKDCPVLAAVVMHGE